MQQPEAYIGGAAQLFDADPAISRMRGTREFPKKFMVAFAAWVEKNSSKNP